MNCTYLITHQTLFEDHSVKLHTIQSNHLNLIIIAHFHEY